MPKRTRTRFTCQLPGFTIDSGLYSTILDTMEQEQDSLSSTINRILRWGLELRGFTVKETPCIEQRRVAHVEYTISNIKLANKVKMPGFHASRETVEKLRQVQGVKHIGDILNEALSNWIEDEAERLSMVGKPLPKPRGRKRKIMGHPSQIWEQEQRDKELAHVKVVLPPKPAPKVERVETEKSEPFVSSLSPAMHAALTLRKIQDREVEDKYQREERAREALEEFKQAKAARFKTQTPPDTHKPVSVTLAAEESSESGKGVSVVSEGSKEDFC